MSTPWNNDSHASKFTRWFTVSNTQATTSNVVPRSKSVTSPSRKFGARHFNRRVAQHLGRGVKPHQPRHQDQTLQHRTGVTTEFKERGGTNVEVVNGFENPSAAR